MESRRPDVDALRVFATYLLFVFHVGKVFDPAPFYHVRNGDLSFALLVVCGFIGLWHMPLFFLLAGWSAARSFAARGTSGFVRERLHRLALPLLAGSIVFGPVIKYIELRSGLDLYWAGLRVAPELQAGFRSVIPTGLATAPPFTESFATFLPSFFTRLDRFSWSHLWFIAYLFTFSMAYLPLFGWLVRRRDRFATAGAWVVYAPIVPLAVVQLTMRARWPGIQNLFDDWANVAYYSVYLLAGFLLACHPALERLVEREWRRSLVVGTLMTSVLLLGVLGVVRSDALLLAGSAVAGWCFVVAFLGVGRRLVTHGSAALSYLAESAFPVYVLHQAAIVVPGWFIVGLPLGIAAKFTALLAVSVCVTVATYHWLVRPFAAPRFLFGMKPKACRLGRPVALSPSAAALVVLSIAIARPGSAAPATPIGIWYAEGGAAEVAIDPCGAELCGRVVWLRSPLDEDGCALRDRRNPDARLRGRKVVGLRILDGFALMPEGSRSDGRIYDPGTGNTYTCRITLDGADRLRVRGYVGIPLIGRTTTWTRVGAEERLCREDD